MANERIYLYCRNCGKRFYLGKHSIDSFHFANKEYRDNLGCMLEEFFEQHTYCDGRFNESEDAENVDPRYMTDYSFVGNFGIVYESSDNYIKCGDCNLLRWQNDRK